jgi:SAM-dependent methyltransferase
MTPAWMSGYVGDVAYTLGFYRELSPSFLNYVCIINGYAGISKSRGLRYCELGCGRGYGTALLAAANPDSEFVGIDFNPSHIGEARDFAARAGIANITFLESSFADAALAADSTIAGFEVVAMHGVYNWVSRGVRDNIHDFLRSRLLPGGIAYISYNVMPGWAAAAPVQRILKEYADRSSGDSLHRVAKGREILKTLGDKSSRFTVENPSAKRRIDMMEKQDPRYIAHEFLNDTWEPLYVTEAMAALAEAKLTYVGSANIAENRLSLCVQPELAQLVQSAPDVALRELLKDYAINKQFRRDVYVKGPTRLSGRDAQRHYDEMALALVALPKPLPETWRIPSGTAKLKDATVNSILAHLAGGPATAGALRAMGKEAGIADGEVPAVLDVLIHNAVVTPCRPDFAALDHGTSQRVNGAIVELALAGDTHRYLAAPVLGSAISTSYFERLAGPVVLEHDGADDSAIAALVFDHFERASKRVMRSGKPLERNDETLSEMAGMIREFRESSLPRWRDLGVLT